MQRTSQPRQVKSLPSGVVVIKSSTKGGMRQIRCPRCKNLAAPTRLTNGAQVTRCKCCGASFKMQKM